MPGVEFVLKINSSAERNASPACSFAIGSKIAGPGKMNRNAVSVINIMLYYHHYNKIEYTDRHMNKSE